MRPRALARLLAPVPAFFGFRIASALLLLKLSAIHLSVGGFAIFSQFLLFASLLNLIAVGGIQNGLIRQSAAAGDGPTLAQTRAAGFAIWMACAPLLLLLIAIGSSAISTVLTGARTYWWVVILIAAIALSAGPGQIWCSLLSGRKRVAASLSAQAAGLIFGTLIAAWKISRGDPLAAAIGFASGSLIAMAVAFTFASSLGIERISPRHAMAQVRTLLRYSGALAATTGFTAIILFGLRSQYRETFGITALGYWMAANRISDMSTQLLGLFMIQFFVPHFATMDNATERRTLVVRCWAAAAVMIAIAILIFAVASEPLVRLFLSDAFIPAIPIIRTYMFGDLLRIWASLAMFAAFARGRPGFYAGIEIGAITVMAVIALVLMSAGDERAPQLAYLGAYAITAIVVTFAFLWRPRWRRAIA